MNENDRLTAVQRYIEQIGRELASGQATEHSYRPALKELLGSLDESIEAINEPKQSEHGAPDFVVIGKKNKDIKLGYGEAKIPGESLDKIEKSEQMDRYRGYANLFLTDCLDWRFYRNGEKIFEIQIGEVKRGELTFSKLHPDNYLRLADEIANFLNQTPESIKSGKRLAEIMGGKARRIRDNVTEYLTDGTSSSQELVKMYEMMKRMLVHDLSDEKFADMYAQTLVYGLFVARYGDNTPNNFTRSEARDLVPASNPFLRHFFDHIVGPNFDSRLGYIVDELCEIFSVSNVQEIVHKHLRIQDESSDAKDPIIHFYEDFLHEYDPAERKRMGAYYTPTPVVKYIVRQVDRILREEFGIAKGLASAETITQTVDTQPWRKKGERKDRLTKEITVPRVQVLDPAVGTATFLNETIKFIHKEFEGQEGRWPSYVNDNLLKRLHGFELMMAPYTIAHLKLGMTLKETGVIELSERLGVYLTNTLEEGIPQQPDLFSFGLAEAVSEESRLAAEVKSERPVMVVMGNPPYSVSSNNKSKFIQNLIADYKKDLNERNIQPLSDDYIKFIRFAEDMIAKNGEGVVAMITNNSYIDGLIHRQMRKHLLQTFDKIYVLDLHGNSKKKEVAPDGSKDVNVFDIQQGVGIILAVKTGAKKGDELGEVYHSDIYGVRQYKFSALDADTPDFKRVSATAPSYYFLPKDGRLQDEYRKFISMGDLFVIHNAGVATGKDSQLVGMSEDELKNQLEGIKFSDNTIINYKYRPFDTRQSLYDNNLVQRLRLNVMKHAIVKDNMSLVATQLNRQISTLYVSVTQGVVDRHYLDSAADSMHVFPIYLYHEDGTRTENFNQAELSALLHDAYQHATSRSDVGVLIAPPEPEDVLDYIYAVLHSPSYREKYKEFLKIDFPRIPKPKTFEEFYKLVEWGKMLRELHLMKSPLVNDYTTTYPIAGDDTVDKLRYDEGKVYINNTQYFGNVPETAWNFYIGGYQPAQKWLKDRRGRTLSSDDLHHYQKIIKILLETDRVMEEIG